MRKITKIATVGFACFGLASAVNAADFNWGGFIETGYLYQVHPGAGNDDNGTFHAREANFHMGGKMGDNEGYAEFAYASGTQGLFYGYNTGTSTAYAVRLNQAHLTLHPSFMGSDSWWKWGRYVSPFGYEGDVSTNNTFLGRSFNHTYLRPTYVAGTSIGKNFGMLWADLHVVNGFGFTAGSFTAASATTAAILTPVTFSGNSFDNNEAPGMILALGAGSKDSIYLNFSFGFSAELANNSGNAIILDTVLGVNAIQNLKLAANFTWDRVKPTAASANRSAWGISAMADYMFHDDMGAGFRFDYMKDKNGVFLTNGRVGSGSDLGIALDVHYALHKNVTAKFEYGLQKATDDLNTAEKPTHVLAWSTVIHY